MPETATQEWDIRESQQIADNTTGQGTSQLYRDYMAGNVKDSSLTIEQRNRLAFEDAYKGVPRLTAAQQAGAAHYGTRHAAPVESVRVPEDYGKSRYDRRILSPTGLDDLNESRAMLQPNSAKIFNGIVKGMGLLVTTALAGTGLDLLADVAAGGYALASGEGERRPGETDAERWQRIQYQAQNNPFQKAITGFNDWLEEQLPNYYREGEQGRGFFQSLGSANFWGNEFIKNLGYMIGAIVGAKIGAGAAMTKLASLNKSRNVVKTAVDSYRAATGAKKAISAGQIARAFASGQAEINGLKISTTLGKAARSVQRSEIAAMMGGGFLAAHTEAQQEAIGNSNEYINTTIARLKEMREYELAGIDERLREEDPSLFVKATDDSPADGMFRGRTVYVPNPDRMDEYTRRHAEMENRVNGRFADHEDRVRREAEKYAVSDYWANMPILFAEDMLVFGSFLSGGYRTGRIVNGMVGVDKLGRPAAKAVKYATRVARGVGTGAWEGVQEFLQESLNKTAAKASNARLNTFYGSAFDPDIQADMAEGLLGYLQYAPKTIYEGFRDPETMKQFWIGWLTAAPGIPSITRVENAHGSRAKRRLDAMTPEERRKWHEDNMNKSKLGRFLSEHTFQMQGEMWNAIRESGEEWREAKDLVEKYNDITSNDRFRTVWEGVARGQVILRDKRNAVVAGDKNAYITEQEKELLNIVDTYQRLGRIDEIRDYIEAFRGTSASEIRDLARDGEGVSQYDGLSDEQIERNVSKWADALENTIAKYDEISSNLKTLYGDSLSDSARTELTWMSFHLDSLNERFEECYRKVHDYLFGPEGVLNGRTEGLYGKTFTEEELRAVEDLRNTDARTLLNVASSEEVRDVIGRLEKLTGENAQVSTSYNDMMQTVSDLEKIYGERLEYANGLLALAGDYENMDLFDLELAEEVNDGRVRAAVARLLTPEGRITSVAGLRAFMALNSDLGTPQLLQELRKHDEYRNLADRMVEYGKSVEDLYSALANFEDDPQHGALKRIIDELTNGEGGEEELRRDLEDIASSGEPYADLARRVLERFGRIRGFSAAYGPDGRAASESGDGKEGKARAASPGESGSVNDGAEERDEREPDSSPGLESKGAELSEAESIFKGITDAKYKADYDAVRARIDASGLPEGDRRILRELADRRERENGMVVRYMRDAQQSRRGPNSGIAEASGRAANMRTTEERRALVGSSVPYSSVNRAGTHEAAVAKLLMRNGAYTFVNGGGLASRAGETVYYVRMPETGDTIYTAIRSKDGTVQIGGERYQLLGALGYNRRNPSSREAYNRIHQLFDSERKDGTDSPQVLSGARSKVGRVLGGVMNGAPGQANQTNAERFGDGRARVAFISPTGSTTIVRFEDGKPIDWREVHGLERLRSNGRTGFYLLVKGADGRWQMNNAGYSTLGQVLAMKSALSDRLGGLVGTVGDLTKSEAARMAAADELSQYVDMRADAIYMAGLGGAESLNAAVSGRRIRFSDALAHGGEGLQKEGYMREMIEGGAIVTGAYSSGVMNGDFVVSETTFSAEDAGTKTAAGRKAGRVPESAGKEAAKPDPKKSPQSRLGKKASKYTVLGSGTYDLPGGRRLNIAIVEETDGKGNAAGQLFVDVKKSMRKGHNPSSRDLIEQIGRSGIDDRIVLADLTEDESAFLNFLYDISRHPERVELYNGHEGAYIMTLSTGENVMYYNGRVYLGAEVPALQDALDGSATESQKTEALDDLEETIDGKSAEENGGLSPQLEGEEAEEEGEAFDETARQEKLHPYTTFEWGGRTYAEFADDRVVDITDLGGAVMDNEYIDSHSVKDPEALLMARDRRRRADEEGETTPVTNDSETDDVAGNVDDAAQAEAERYNEDRRNGTVPSDSESFDRETPQRQDREEMKRGISDALKGFVSFYAEAIRQHGLDPAVFSNPTDFINAWDALMRELGPEYESYLSTNMNDAQSFLSRIEDFLNCG